MPLEFIDNNATINRSARRRIRSHVAKGKNAGKTLVRPSRKKAFGLGDKAEAATICIPIDLEDAHGLESDQDKIPEIERQVGDGFSVLSFPERLNPGSRSLVQRAFSFINGPRHAPELRNAIDTATTAPIWVQFMFMDEAYFHCAVATSVTALNSILIKQEDPTEAIRHLSLAIRLVNEKLSGNDPVSDTTIAAVVIMAQYGSLQRQYHQGLVHVEGLQRMVELRGGISQLTRTRPSLIQKIFKTDLEYSLHLGLATRFSIEDVVLGSTAVLGLPNSLRKQEGQEHSKHFDSWVFRQLSTDLQTLLIDTTSLAWLINGANAGHRPKVNEYEFHDTLILLGYRLVYNRPLGGPRPANQLENAIHLGLTAFIMTFLRGIDHKIADVPLLSELARSAAQVHFDSDQENQEVLLWTLFIGGASIFKPLDDAWLIPKKTRTMHALGLHNWEDVSRTLLKFPWVNVTHDKAGQALWHKSTSCYGTLPDVALE